MVVHTLSSIVRKGTAMANFPLSGTEENQEKSKAEDILGHSGTPGIRDTPQESKPLSLSTTKTASTEKSLKKISKTLDYPALRLQSSLVAGYLGMFLKLAGARVKSETVVLLQPNGKRYKAVKIYMAIDETDLEVMETSDGIEFVVEGKRLEVVEE